MGNPKNGWQPPDLHVPFFIASLNAFQMKFNAFVFICIQFMLCGSISTSLHFALQGLSIFSSWIMNSAHLR